MVRGKQSLSCDSGCDNYAELKMKTLREVQSNANRNTWMARPERPPVLALLASVLQAVEDGRDWQLKSQRLAKYRDVRELSDGQTPWGQDVAVIL